jgi:hypothetical protein
MISLSRHKPAAATVTTVQETAEQTEVEAADISMKLGVPPNFSSGALRFFSIEEMKAYLKELQETYSKEYESTTDLVGELYRSMGPRTAGGSATSSWNRMGAIYVNSVDAERASIEVALQLLNDLKPKLTKTGEVLDEFGAIEDMPVSPDSTFVLYMRNGAPERLIVDTASPKDEKFTLSAVYSAA